MEKEVLRYFENDNPQHIVISKRRAAVCENCGFERLEDSFYSVNGCIVEITDSTTIVKLLNGNLRTFPNKDILRIEDYNEDIAGRRRKGRFQ
jgi:hypothetical protein